MNTFYSKSTARAVMTLLVTLFCTLTAWAQGYPDNNVNYYLNSDQTAAYVGSSSDASGDITILAQVKINGTDYNVTSIGDMAFSGTGLTSVTIPASVESIGEGAFAVSGNLSSVNFADNSNLTSIGESAFTNTGLESITIPASVKSIEGGAFNSCTSLSTVDFADNSKLTSIGERAFQGTGLESITIPASVESIGAYAFYGISRDLHLTIQRSDESELYLGKNAFDRDVTLQYTGDGHVAFEITDNCNYLITDLDVGGGTATLKFVDEGDDRPQAVLKATICEEVDYNDGSANTVSINDNKCIVTLNDRTIYKDGNWNTLCLPFEVNLNASNCPLYGATAMELKESSFENGALSLTFESVTTLTAGTPYLIKMYGGGEIYNPIFPFVTITSTTPGKSETSYVDFVGCYSPVTLAANDTKSLFLGDENYLYYPSEAVTVNSFRGYFQLKGLTAGSTANQIRAINLNFDDDTNSISTIHSDSESSSSWFTLDGRRLNEKPIEKGMYIHGGKKVMIK